MLESWIYQCCKYVRITQGSEYAWICLNNSWICLVTPEYAWIYLIMAENMEICVNMPKYAWLLFVLHFPITVFGYLFQCLLKNGSYCLKEHESVFRQRKFDFFSIVAGSIWFVFCFRLKKISNLLLTFRGEAAGGRESGVL